MRRDEPDIQYLFRPRSIAVKGKLEIEEMRGEEKVFS